MLVAVSPQLNTPQREAPQPKSSLQSPSRYHKRKKLRRTKEHTKCICGNPKCDKTMERLHMLGKTEYGYFNIPTRPKPTQANSSIRKKRQQERHVQTERKGRILAALPGHGQLRANDDTYSSKTYLRYASIHIHPRVFNFCNINKSNNR